MWGRVEERATTGMRTGLALLSVALLAGCLHADTDYQVNYGLNHYRMGLYNQAIPPLVTAAKSLEKTNPPDPRLPEVLLALGAMAAADQRVEMAEGFYLNAVKAADGLATPDENAQRNALVNGGNFYLAQRRPKDALPLLERAATISEQSARFRRTLHAIDLDNLGQAYSGQKRYSEGRALGLRALKVLDAAQAEPDAAKTRGVVHYNLAYGYMEEGLYAEAETNYRRALEILAPSGAPQVGETWRVEVVLTNYAILLRKVGRGNEAATLEHRNEQLPAR